jgi:hypothetical protein
LRFNSVVLFFILALQSLFAQKILTKTLNDPTLSQIYIQAQDINSLSITSVESKEFLVRGVLDGEYSTHQMLSIVRKGNTLYVVPDFTDKYEIPNDKLSAHKVFAIALDMFIPSYLEVVVSGEATRVSASGRFKKLNINLVDGMCSLNDIGEQVYVNSQSGPIFLNQKEGFVTAKSSYGLVEKESIPKGNSVIVLHSVSGHIKVTKQRP